MLALYNITRSCFEFEILLRDIFRICSHVRVHYRTLLYGRIRLSLDKLSCIYFILRVSICTFSYFLVTMMARRVFVRGEQ